MGSYRRHMSWQEFGCLALVLGLLGTFIIIAGYTWFVTGKNPFDLIF